MGFGQTAKQQHFSACATAMWRLTPTRKRQPEFLASIPEAFQLFGGHLCDLKARVGEMENGGIMH